MLPTIGILLYEAYLPRRFIYLLVNRICSYIFPTSFSPRSNYFRNRDKQFLANQRDSVSIVVFSSLAFFFPFLIFPFCQVRIPARALCAFSAEYNIHCLFNHHIETNIISTKHIYSRT